MAPKGTRFPLCVRPLSSVHIASSSAVLWQNSFIPRSQSSYQPAPFHQQQHNPVLLLLSSSFSSSCSSSSSTQFPFPRQIQGAWPANLIDLITLC